ncbi:hypothetical protein CRYUN_Cryun09bG0131000 [Craigia yunnanensis]
MSESTAIANCCAKVPENSKRSGDCLSLVSSDILSVAVMERNGVSQVEHENIAAGDPKTVDGDSINDSCSSLKSNMELALASMKGEMDENGECSTSSVIASEVVREDLSEKDMCLSILWNQGNPEEVGPSRSPINYEIGTSGGSSCSRLCKICGRSETAQKMLICDNCEEAFHETTISTSKSITGGMDRCRDVSSKGDFSPIELMLRDAEPYRTSVRIGKGFQAEVPDWSGPIENDVDTIGEPLEWDPSEFTDFHIRLQFFCVGYHFHFADKWPFGLGRIDTSFFTGTELQQVI